MKTGRSTGEKPVAFWHQSPGVYEVYYLFQTICLLTSYIYIMK